MRICDMTLHLFVDIVYVDHHNQPLVLIVNTARKFEQRIIIAYNSGTTHSLFSSLTSLLTANQLVSDNMYVFRIKLVRETGFHGFV